MFCLDRGTWSRTSTYVPDDLVVTQPESVSGEPRRDGRGRVNAQKRVLSFASLNKKEAGHKARMIWYVRRESNPHSLSQQILRLPRIPFRHSRTLCPLHPKGVINWSRHTESNCELLVTTEELCRLTTAAWSLRCESNARRPSYQEGSLPLTYKGPYDWSRYEESNPDSLITKQLFYR
jgi:hypothetical protein